MKRKFFGALLMGAFVLAATSTVTSCKDYDDDINSLQKQIDDLSTLKTVKTELETEISDLKAQLEAADAKLQTAIDSKANASTVTSLAADVSSLEARIENAEKTLTAVQKAIETNSGNISELNAQLASVNTDLAKLQKGLTDEETARKAVAVDLEEQASALEKLTDRVKSLESGLTEAQKKEITDKISELQKQITELKGSVESNASDLKTLKETTIPGLYDKLTQFNDYAATLNVFITGQLRSLVFIPEAYYWGVEALKAVTLDYAYYSNFSSESTPAENWVAASADNKEPVGYTECARYNHQVGSTAKDLVAHYHMNPSIADVPDLVSILDADKWFETESHTRASEAGISVKSFEKNGGQLDVTLKFNDPNKIKSVQNDSLITVFASQAKYTTAGNDTTITSDYAAVYKTTVSDLVLSHTTTGDEGSFTGQTNTCNVDFKNNPDNLHSINNCTMDNKKDLHLIPSVFDAIAFSNQDVCRYDKTLDLSKLVETHYKDANGNHKLMSAQELKDYGLEYQFELTASFLGGNQTSEAAHAGIKGTTFRPQVPKEDGKAYTYDEYTAAVEAGEQTEENLRAHAVGREPIVRVSLVDTNNGNRVLDYGYIKIKITDKTTEEIVKPNVTITYEGDPIDYKSECAPANYTLTKTWYQIEYDVLRMLNLHKEEFDNNYDRNGQLVINSSDVVMQYNADSVKTSDATLAAELNPYIGTVVDNYDANNSETSTFTWTIPSSYIESSLYGKASHDPFKIAVRYKSKDQSKYPDLYIILKTGKITISKSTGTFLAADGSDRIKEYWYKDNGNSAAEYGLAEIHAQTLSPEDPNAGSVASVLDDRFSDVFVGNNITLASVTDITPNGDFAVAKRQYNFVFSDKNTGKKFNGVDTLSNGDYKKVEWTLGIANNGKALVATHKDGVIITPDTIAKITGSYTDATGIKSQKVVYTHSEAAHSLLNYVAHNKLADDVLKAIISLQVKTNACEHELTLTNKEFNVRFLRPINVDGVDKSLEDAEDKVQKIALKDLVTLSDWRDYGFADHTGYWKYYNIKDIRVIGNYELGTLTDQSTGIINPFIYTTMTKAGGSSNSLADKIKQSTISNQVLFRAIEGDNQANGEYGYLLYENLSSTVQTFTVRVPLLVSYEWGYVTTYVDVTIKNTHSNAKRN